MRLRPLLALCLLPALGCAGEGAPARPEPVKDIATLGADLETLGPPQDPIYRGALVQRVEEGGPAAVAELQPDDVIRQIDEKRVSSLCELELELLKHEAGEEIRVEIDRKGWSIFKTVKLGSAFDLYGEGCDAGRAASCYQLGVLYTKGTGLAAPDPALGRELFDRACQGGSAAGCAHLAYAYAEGIGVPEDDNKALELYMEACGRGEAAGCYNVGVNFDAGAGTPQSHFRALSVFERSCDLGYSRACTNVGFFHERGKSVPEDPLRARVFFRRACEGTSCDAGDPMGCFNLGVLYRDARGGTGDKPEAARLFELSCNGGNALGCANLADLLAFGDGVPKDEERAARLFRLACNGGHETACQNAEILESQQRGRQAK